MTALSQATLKGFTQPITADGGPYCLTLMVKPDSDLDGQFVAFDVDACEYIRVNGWLFGIEEGH